MKPIIRKSFASAALALGLGVAPFAIAGAGLLVPASAAYAKSAPTIAEMKQTLAQYGEFVSHETYGDVWRPTVTPRGWHPYPACDWVFTKDYGWYFSDKTAWGSIVHHYGRWIHEEKDGWLWVPGAEFSPGWVTWRTSSEWVGWAPTPPDAEMTEAKMAAFDDDKLWTFMDAKKFGKTCDGVATTAQYGDIYGGTTFVTDIRFVGGIGVFVLPTWISGPVVNIDIDVFGPWSPTFIGSWVWNWTNITDIDITINKFCKPNDQGGGQPGPNGDEPKKVNDVQPDPKNPKPFRPSLKNDAPPPPPGKGPRPQNIRTFDDGGQRQPGRTARTFEPAPDDVVVRRPGRQGPREIGRDVRPQRDPVRVRLDRDRGPDRGGQDAGRQPRRIYPDGQFPGRGGDRDFRKPSFGGGRSFEPNMTPRRQGGMGEARAQRFGGQGRTFERFRD